MASTHWMKVMQVEYDALLWNKTWKMVPNQINCKIVG